MQQLLMPHKRLMYQCPQDIQMQLLVSMFF